MKKDKDGNWEFEYDTPVEDDDSEHSEPENATIQQASLADRPTISGISGEGQSIQTLNLVVPFMTIQLN